jgi:peptidyl-prolyl cis-trans isomerase D
VEKLPDAEAKATQRLKEAKARKLAQESAQRARGELAGDTLAAVAKKYHLTPQETPLFGMREPVPGLGVRPNFHQAAMKLKPKEVSPLVDLVEGYAVLQGAESIPEHVPGLDQIKDQVQGALKRQMAGKQAEQEAEQLLQRLRKGEALEKVTAQSGFPLKDSGFFTRFQGFLNQPAAEAVTGAAFQLSKEHPYPDKPISWQDKYYLLAFKARRAPDPAEFQKERETLEKNVLDYKRQLLLSSWLGGERRRAKIKVFELPF